jgi:tripartite-type tricarboxylate transporter receptor subunit TctC
MPPGKKYGGRVAGTPNKTTSTVRSAISKMLDKYFNSEEFEEDLKKLKPKERVDAMEKFSAYVAPKLQSTTLDATIEAKKTIEDKLATLAGDDE